MRPKTEELVVISYTGREISRISLTAENLPSSLQNDISHSVDRLTKFGGKYILQVKNKLYQFEINNGELSATEISVKDSDFSAITFIGRMLNTVMSQKLENTCVDNKCDQMCVPTRLAPVCLCNVGYVIDADGTTCKKIPKELL